MVGALLTPGALKAAAFAANPLVCDVNGDGVVTLADLNLIRAKNNQNASGPTDPFDPNHDGKINVADLRYCQLRMTSTNQAPVVSAGANQAITLPAQATLSGSVTDDGLPQGATVTSQWTQQSGPGVTTFANASSPATTVTFSAAGTYMLRLTASDTALSAFAETTVTVAAARRSPDNHHDTDAST